MHRDKPEAKWRTEINNCAGKGVSSAVADPELHLMSSDELPYVERRK